MTSREESPTNPPPTANSTVDTLMREAVELNRQGRVEDSLRVWQRVLALDPDHPEALFHLGHHLLRQGNANDAETLFKKALTRAEGAPLVHFALAQVANKLGRTDDELRALDRVLSRSLFRQRFAGQGSRL